MVGAMGRRTSREGIRGSVALRSVGLARARDSETRSSEVPGKSQVKRIFVRKRARNS